MDRYLLTFLACFISMLAFSQTGDNTNYNKTESRNAFYIEAGGAGINASINYERRYIPSEIFRYGFRIGYGRQFSELKVGPKPGGNTAVPLMGVVSIGKLAHQLDMELGTTLVMNRSFGTGNTQYPTIEGKVGVVGTGQIGYRFYPHTEGLMVRVSYTPMLFYLNAGNPIFEHWVGVSIGWALPNSK